MAKIDIPFFDGLLAMVLADLTLFALITLVWITSGVALQVDTDITNYDIVAGILRYFILAGAWYAVIKLVRLGLAKLNHVGKSEGRPQP
jgi:phosphate starvation-inducible membrane PsiE